MIFLSKKNREITHSEIKATRTAKWIPCAVFTHWKPTIAHFKADTLQFAIVMFFCTGTYFDWESLRIQNPSDLTPNASQPRIEVLNLNPTVFQAIILLLYHNDIKVLTNASAHLGPYQTLISLWYNDPDTKIPIQTGFVWWLPIVSSKYRYLYQFCYVKIFSLVLITIKFQFCWTTLVVLEVR